MTKLLHTDQYDSAKTITTDGTIITATGGDGTLLRAISAYKHLNLPFFGIAGGTVNFLMNESDSVLPTAITKSLELLHVVVKCSDGQHTVEAFNDVILGAFNGWVHFDCIHQSDILGQFSGSAIIIATPQGSTGATKNNDGVVLPLSSHTWSVSGVTCNKRINYVLDREPITIKPTSRGTISLAVDGTTHTFSDVISVTISRGTTVDVIFNDYTNFTKKRRQ